VVSTRETQTTLEVTQLEAIINDYISRELIQDAALLPFGNAAPLQAGVPEHFASVDTICAYLCSRAGGRAGQGGGHG
jgi:hypothetical protein